MNSRTVIISKIIVTYGAPTGSFISPLTDTVQSLYRVFFFNFTSSRFDLFIKTDVFPKKFPDVAVPGINFVNTQLCGDTIS
jgi:hypothetical protein